MVNYGFEIIGLKDKAVKISKTFDSYYSEIISVNPEKNEALIEEIIKFCKDTIEEFNQCDYIYISQINPTYTWILQKYPSEAKDAKRYYDESMELWNKHKEECEVQELILAAERTLVYIKFLRDKFEEKGLLDSQNYLNFLDELNKLSIDQDRQ